MTLKRWLYRLLGIQSPSGAYSPRARREVGRLLSQGAAEGLNPCAAVYRPHNCPVVPSLSERLNGCHTGGEGPC